MHLAKVTNTYVCWVIAIFPKDLAEFESSFVRSHS